MTVDFETSESGYETFFTDCPSEHRETNRNKRDGHPLKIEEINGFIKF
jgi:hypothetical protein